MIIDTVKSGVFAQTTRLDSSYHLSPGVKAARRLQSAREKGSTVRHLNDLADVSAPKRFKRAYAAPKEESAPYLRPYDIFDYLPVAADLLSVSRNAMIEDLRLTTDTILLTCSGRNLGPAVAVDQYLAQFVLSHDAIRIRIDDARMRMYVLTFLNTPTGQELVRRDMSGSVIDHITTSDAEALTVPILDQALVDSVVEKMALAVRLREEARIELKSLGDEIEKSLPEISTARPSAGWQVSVSEIGGRIDSAPYLPKARSAASQLEAMGGQRLGDVAFLHKPASRYKAYHVSREHGQPFLAGGQLRQEHVIGPKFMAERVFTNPEWYRIHAGETVFAADGRAYEGLGVPVMVTPDRDGWLASEHVLRARPKPGTHAGWLYLALASRYVQEQIQVLARGSVVDTLYATDVADIVLPPQSVGNGERAYDAWAKFSLASDFASKAVSELESHLVSLDGSPIP